ncbi:TPA: hypothetical protein ACOB2J_000909 [Neisseria gonorrhoeae]
MGNTRIPIKSFFKQLVLFVFNIFLAYEILPDVQAESAAGCPVPDCRGNGKTDVPCGFCPNEWRVLFLSICFFFFEIKFLKY